VREDSEDFKNILLGDLPLLDVRAPVEFAQGAFPRAVNLPLMNDQERQQVGLRYKQAGQDHAIKLGHQLVSGATKDERVGQWLKFARANPTGYLYCFRGGLRSRISQQWLKEAGLEYPRIIGGYKAMRGFLIESLQQTVANSQFTLVAGLTGSGKTQIIHALNDVVDLEKLAHHRGSSFGKHSTEQPVQINFDNNLSIDLLRLHARGVTRIALEDESRLIGKCALPIPMRDAMSASPLVWVAESTEARTERILHDYVEDLGAQFVRLLGAELGFDAFSARLLESLKNLYKRLGGERHTRLESAMKGALSIQRATAEIDAHRLWIKPLLTEYYDPMYVHQRESKASRIIFEGNLGEVIDYFKRLGY